MKISIITVSYNSEKTISKTIESVYKQNYQDFEYIIIDGQSNDKTLDIIKQYKTIFKEKMIWVSEKDKGIYDAMNKGLQKATGDYVWFINAGDSLFTSDIVQRVASLVQKKKVLPDIIYGETVIVDEEGKSLGQRRLKAPNKLTWKSFRMGMLVCHQSFITKRSIAPLYDLTYRYSADFDWCIRCMKQAGRIYNTRMTLSNFLDGGVSTTQRKASLKERYDIMCRYYGVISTSLLHVWFAIRFYFAKWFKGRV